MQRGKLGQINESSPLPFPLLSSMFRQSEPTCLCASVRACAPETVWRALCMCARSDGLWQTDLELVRNGEECTLHRVPDTRVKRSGLTRAECPVTRFKIKQGGVWMETKTGHGRLPSRPSFERSKSCKLTNNWPNWWKHEQGEQSSLKVQ